MFDLNKHMLDEETYGVFVQTHLEPVYDMSLALSFCTRIHNIPVRLFHDWVSDGSDTGQALYQP